MAMESPGSCRLFGWQRKQLQIVDTSTCPWLDFVPFVRRLLNWFFMRQRHFKKIGSVSPCRIISLLILEKIASCQSLSGTGALLLAGMTIQRGNPAIKNVLITDPTWSNHELLFQTIGFQVHKLPYYKNGAFDFEGYLNGIKAADSDSVIVLHSCAHNPTGCDPSREQWKEIAAVIKEKALFPVLDSAYLGFNSGSIDEDAWVIRYLVEELGLEVSVCMSFAKSMGLYGMKWHFL